MPRFDPTTAYDNPASFDAITGGMVFDAQSSYDFLGAYDNVVGPIWDNTVPYDSPGWTDGG